MISIISYPATGFIIYEIYLRERWQQGCRNGAQLYREVVAMGYPGKRKQVARLVAHLRKQPQAGVTDFSTQPLKLTQTLLTNATKYVLLDLVTRVSNPR